MNSTKEIKNKKVVIVGGSNILEGKQQGEMIDNFDYVVRLNGAIRLLNDPKYIIDYGTRDDIHFFTNPYIREMQPKLVNPPFYLFKFGYKQYKNLKHEVIGQSIKEVQKHIYKGFVYSGIAVLYHLLKQKPAKIHLLGMDLYVDEPNYYDGTWKGYIQNYVPEKMKRFTDKEHADGHLAHSRFWNAAVLRNLILQYSEIIHIEDEFENTINYILKNRIKYE